MVLTETGKEQEKLDSINLSRFFRVKIRERRNEELSLSIVWFTWFEIASRCRTTIRKSFVCIHCQKGFLHEKSIHVNSREKWPTFLQIELKWMAIYPVNLGVPKHRSLMSNKRPQDFQSATIARRRRHFTFRLVIFEHRTNWLSSIHQKCRNEQWKLSGVNKFGRAESSRMHAVKQSCVWWIWNEEKEIPIIGRCVCVRPSKN